MGENTKQSRGGKAFQSVLMPHFDFIREQRQRRKTWQEITELVFAEKSIRVSLHTVYYFYKGRLKRIGRPRWEDAAHVHVIDTHGQAEALILGALEDLQVLNICADQGLRLAFFLFPTDDSPRYCSPSSAASAQASVFHVLSDVI